MALLAIFSHGPMPMFSTRTLAVAWEMWAHGHWLVPHINGEPYSEKVPLLFWMIHAGWAVFGVNDVWPRILEVIFGGAQLVRPVLAGRLFPDAPLGRQGDAVVADGVRLCLPVRPADHVRGAARRLGAGRALCLTPKADRAEPAGGCSAS